MTRSRQSHWNFMLLGSKVEVPTGEPSVIYEVRKQREFTPYFLVKMIYRLQLHKIEIDWAEIRKLKAGSRWRVLSHPSHPAKEGMEKKYGKVKLALIIHRPADR